MLRVFLCSLTPRRLLVPGMVLAVLAACSATPPAPAGREAAYRADYDSCGKAVPEAVNKRNAKTGLAWFASPVRRWGQIDDGMAACMADKGWGGTRACTPAELRGGNNTPGLIVTAAGVRCTDPGTR